MNDAVTAATIQQNNNTTTLEPGKLWVISRDNTEIREFDPERISIAIAKAYLADFEDNNTGSVTQQTHESIHERVKQLTLQITTKFQERQPTGGTILVEDIQDQVELALMRAGERNAARMYILYREEHRKQREEQLAQEETVKHTLHITLKNGQTKALDIEELNEIVNWACADLDNVEAQRIIEDTQRNLFDGAPEEEVNKALIMTARTQVEKEPNYSFVTARLLLNSLYNEGSVFLGLTEHLKATQMADLYPAYFQAYIERGIELELLSPELAKRFDTKKLGDAIIPKRDFQFTYLGLQTLYDRYFIHSDDTRFELPQTFFMRVAMGLAIEEDNPTERAIEFYLLLSSTRFMSSTPTLFNSGTLRPQLSSCFLTTIPDDLDGIYGGIKDNALLSKFAGGIGNDWTPVRAMNAKIKGTNGKSLGVVPFMNVADATAVAVNQGGKRKGAVCGYLETWHLDIEEFLDLRKNTGDERRRTHDMNTANWVPDLFMQRVIDKADWTLFSPEETPELHDIYGSAFEAKYTEYEAKAAKGEVRNFKVVSAQNLWRKMLSMIFETGHPWVTFKDPCNLRSPQQHAGVVHSSNLCTEITLNTSHDEIAVCNLGSINLPAHMDSDGHINKDMLRETVHTAIRMLDNVININYYTVEQARNANLKHRPIGLGIMGFQDALYKRKLAYTSEAAVIFADRSMELISYYAIEASSNLAADRGSYQSFDGSLWSQGILPIDSIKFVQETRKEFLQDTSSTLDWGTLRKKVQTQGMRNSNVLAIAPTATISNICGVSQSIEPTYQNLYVKSNMSGEFTVINPYLADELKALELWDDVMIHDLKYYNGSLQSIARIPEDIKERYRTAFEIDPKWLIDAGSRRQKWIDQSQSLNLYIAKPSGKKLDQLYKHAWVMGLKTTYYLRSLGATNTEKSTIADAALNAVQVNAAPQACSIDDPDCEACQ